MLSTQNLRAVGDDESLPTFGAPAIDPQREAALEERERRATEWMMTALKTFSQRALIALAAIEHLILAGCVFALWLNIIPAPTHTQLIGGSIFSSFVLALCWLRRK